MEPAVIGLDEAVTLEIIDYTYVYQYNQLHPILFGLCWASTIFMTFMLELCHAIHHLL